MVYIAYIEIMENIYSEGAFLELKSVFNNYRFLRVPLYFVIILVTTYITLF